MPGGGKAGTEQRGGQEQALVAPPQRPAGGERGHSQVPSLEHILQVFVVSPHHTHGQSIEACIQSTRFNATAFYPHTFFFLFLMPKHFARWCLRRMDDSHRRHDKMMQSKQTTSLSSSFQPATKVYKPIRCWASVQERKHRLQCLKHSDDTTGCRNKCHSVCMLRRCVFLVRGE